MSTRCSSGSLRHKHPYVLVERNGRKYFRDGAEGWFTAIYHHENPDDKNSKILKIEIVPSTINK